ARRGVQTTVSLGFDGGNPQHAHAAPSERSGDGLPRNPAGTRRGTVAAESPVSSPAEPADRPRMTTESSMPFELQPTLTDELLELRPLRPEDFDILFAVASDPLIWEQHPANDRYKEDVFREFFREAMKSGGAFVAVDAKDGQVIGSSRYY